MQKPSERVSRWKHLGGGPQRKQTVGVDRHQAHTQLFACSGHHTRQEKAWEVIGYDYGRIRGQGFQQSVTSAGFGFHVGVIKDAALLANSGVVRHAINYELVDAIAGPLVPTTKGFENDQRLA